MAMFMCLAKSMDDIEELIIMFMIDLIVRVMAEHATSLQLHEICSMHNSSLMGNTWLIGMLNKNFLVRCCDLLRMLQHMPFRLYDELKAKIT